MSKLIFVADMFYPDGKFSSFVKLWFVTVIKEFETNPTMPTEMPFDPLKRLT